MMDISSLIVTGEYAKLRNLIIRQKIISGALQIAGEGDYEFDGIEVFGEHIAYLMNVKSPYSSLKIKGVRFNDDKTKTKSNIVRSFNSIGLEKITWGRHVTKIKDL